MRIASLSPAITEILFCFGRGHDIVCTDQFSYFPEETKAIPHLRDHIAISPKDVSEFVPDLVCTSTVIQQKLAKELENAGMAVVHFDPRTLAGVYEMITALGIIFTEEKKAEALVVQMQKSFTDLKRKAHLLPSHVRMYIEEWHAPPFASGNWVPEIASFAGVQQFPIPAGELSTEVSLQQVLAYDPDIIVISWCGAGVLVDTDILRNRDGWNALRAVQSRSIRVIDDSLLNRPGPRLVEGAQRLYGWAFEYLHS